MLQKVHIDFDPVDCIEKFPMGLSLESIATVTVPMGEYQLCNWRSECNSIWKYDGHTAWVDKFSSSGSYLNICEECKCKSNNKEVCDCDLRSFHSHPDCIPAWNNSRDSEIEFLDKDSVVTVAPRELRTDVHNDSGIECGFV